MQKYRTATIERVSILEELYAFLSLAAHLAETSGQPAGETGVSNAVQVMFEVDSAVMLARLRSTMATLP